MNTRNGYCLFMKKKMQANGKEWKKLSDKDRMEYDSRRVQAKKEYFESLEKNVLTLPQEEAAKYQSELAASKVPSKSRINIQKELKPSAEGFFILSTGVAGEERAGGTPGGKRFLQQTEVVEGFRSSQNVWIPPPPTIPEKISVCQIRKLFNANYASAVGKGHRNLMPYTNTSPQTVAMEG
ncbi:uncharacterized protein [Apostichopus japonicus]|uniref:uncharacterized protein isoform X2 n=1 Tax=Stichopus japonicus TaxID=307972 RepID=UPI003AB5E5AD